MLHLAPPVRIFTLILCSLISNPKLMKTLATTLLFAAFLLSPVSRVSAQQFAFGMQYACEADDAFAKVTLPVSALVDMINESGEAIPPADVCLVEKPTGTLSGYQADFDGDGTEEMWLMYQTGSGADACAVTLVVAPVGGGKYQLMDIPALPSGTTALIRPIITLDQGVQMYLQTSSTLGDGTQEVKGSILWYTQTALIILTSWTQHAGMRDGKFVAEKVDAVWTDTNFDQVKELVIRYSIHETGGGAMTSSNIVDQYILTLDFLPNHLRYGLYDSVGYEQLQQAETKARAARIRMNREETRIEGIVAIREALDVNPFMNWVWVRLGESLLMEDHKYGDAEYTLLQAALFNPEHNKTWRLLGDTYLRLNNLQKALEAYTRYMELGPESNYYKRKVEHNIKQITIPRKTR